VGLTKIGEAVGEASLTPLTLPKKSPRKYGITFAAKQDMNIKSIGIEMQ